MTASERIREVIERFARLPVPVDSLSEEADLYEAGMSSHASVNVMLGLEDAFDLEFPDHMLTREVFGSIAGIRDAVSELQTTTA